MSPAAPGPGGAPPVRYGSRDGSAGCPGCGQPRPSGRARYCSEACKQRAYRWRQRALAAGAPVAPRLPARARRGLGAQTIYECPVCATRYLGLQRCPDCQRFCRALGLGGACPHCDEPVLSAELFPP